MNENCWLKNNCSKIDCNTFCLKYFKLNKLYELALVPLERRKHVTLRIDDDNSDEQAFNTLKTIETNIVDFVKSGKNLFIYSSICGNGKSQWSLRMIESYLNKVWLESKLECKVLFISVSKFLLALKDNISKENEYINFIKENVEKCDLVVWDDIATKLGTEFEISHLLSYIDSRILNNKANIYTSNVSGTDLCKALGERLYSRIVNYSDYVIEFVGKDKRNIKEVI